MLKRFLKKIELRRDAVAKAREGFTSWLAISESSGWKIYEREIEKNIDNIRNQMENKDELSGEDLKRLQLALKVYREVQRIPKKLKDNARGGLKDAT